MYVYFLVTFNIQIETFNKDILSRLLMTTQSSKCVPQEPVRPFLHGNSTVTVESVTSCYNINKARKPSFVAPRKEILQSDWSNKNESYTPGTLVQGSVCRVAMT